MELKNCILDTIYGLDIELFYLIQRMFSNNSEGHKASFTRTEGDWKVVVYRLFE